MAGPTLDRQQLISLVEAAQKANCHDVTHNYEGRSERIDESGVWHDEEVFTGNFQWRNDGATLVEIYSTQVASQRKEKGVIAILSGEDTFLNHQPDQKNAVVTIRRQGPLVFAGPRNFRACWSSDLVKKFADSSYNFDFEGFQDYQGSQHAVVRFWLVAKLDPSKRSQTASERFWIDLQRGGHVTRHEQLEQGDHIATVMTVSLREFVSPKGRQVWLPAEGNKSTYISVPRSGPLKFLKAPVRQIHYHLLDNTLRVDQGLSDEVFSVRPRPGDLVSDQIRQARYEFGQYLVRPKTVTRAPTDAEIRAEVDRMLKDSARMARELKASSPAQEASVWGRVWPWVIAGGALLGASVVVLRQRRR